MQGRVVKARRSPTEPRPLGIGFAVGPILKSVGSPSNDADAVGTAYEARLRRELEPLVSSGKVEIHRRWPAPVGSALTINVDWIDLIVKGVAFYAALRIVGADLRTLIGKLGMLADGMVYVDEPTAEYLAVEAVAFDVWGTNVDGTEMVEQVAKVADIEIMGTTPLRAHPDVFNVPPSGFIVDLKVNRRRRRVVVSHDGQVAGVTTDKRYDYPDLVALQEERKYALLDRPAKAGNRKAGAGKPS